MCGRARLSSDVSEIKIAFGIPPERPAPNFPPSWNVAPTDSLPVVRYDAKARQRSLDMLRWGLIPYWAKDIKVGFANINAKAEGIESKPAFGKAFERRRCVVPVDSFYEWKKTGTGKQPYAIALANRRIMALAGLWENWHSPAGEWVRSFAIITTTLNISGRALFTRLSGPFRARRRLFHTICFRRSRCFNRPDAPAIVVETQASMPVMTSTPTASSDMPMTPKPQTLASEPTGGVRPAVSAAPTTSGNGEAPFPSGTEDASRIVSATVASVSRESCTQGTEPSAFSLRHQETDGNFLAGVRPRAAVTAKGAGREMPEPIFTTLSLDELAQQPASRSKPQISDPGYLASVGAVAAVIIGVFFGIGFSLLAPEHIIGGSGTGNRSTEVKTLHSIGRLDLSSDAQPAPADAEQPPSAAVASLQPPALAHRPMAREDATPENATASQSSVSAASEAVISTAAGAVSSTGASAVGSMANETTLARPATVSPPERFPAATTATPPASPPMAAEIAELLARGDSFVVIGDIASARVFYERAASAGDGRAALRMGTTFDPAFLRRAGLPRTFGDPALARSWYRRAFDLDDDEVKRRRNAVDTR